MLRTLARLCLLLAALCANLLHAGDPLEDIKLIPASNPYRSIMERYARLSQEDRDALNNWISPPTDSEASPPPGLTATQKLLASEFTSALVATAALPPSTAADWAPAANPADPDNPCATLIPAVGEYRQLARIATKQAELLPPSDAIAAYAAVAQLGRQQRAGASLIQQLTGVAIEGIAQAEAAKRLGTFSAEQLQQLSAAFNDLHPAPSVADSIAGERDIFFNPFIKKILLPGLRALLEEETDLGTSTTPSQPESERTFTRDLRLSGLLDLGEGERRVLLENTKTGAVLTLLENRPVEGITLTGINFEKRLAYIRHETREAVIHLQSKQIVERSLAAERLRTLLGGNFGMFGINSRDSEKALRAWLDQIRARPDGAEGYVRDLLASYDRIYAEQIALSAKAIAQDSAAKPADPLLAAFVPAIGKVARTLQNVQTTSTMLQAAIQLRLRELGHAEATPPADPWAKDGSGFSIEKTPDGGFLLRSRYETSPDKPLTYKFAAPDAGFKRQP